MLTVENVEVVYDDVLLALRGVSLEVPEGSIVTLLGANGAGKTTALRACTGCSAVHRGEVRAGRSRSTESASTASARRRSSRRASPR